MHSVLAARTTFSIGESILSTELLVDRAAALGQKAVAITDTMTVTGMIDFTTRCAKKEIKPIIGVRLRLVDDPTWRSGDGEKKKHMPRSYFLTAYIVDEIGLKAVYSLLSLAYSEKRFYYDAKLGFEDLLKKLAEIDAGHLLFNLTETRGVYEHAGCVEFQKKLTALAGPENVYAALMPVDTPYFTAINVHAMAAIRRGARPLFVRPAFYDIDGADAHEIMGAVTNNNKITDGWHKSTWNRDFHLLSSLQMIKAVVDLAARRLPERGVANHKAIVNEGIENTRLFDTRITFTWSKQPVSLPKMAPDEFVAVKDECKKGWADRFSRESFGHKPTGKELRDLYLPRLQYELSVLERLNFSGYFLLVQDVVRFAKTNGILVGPGRGSVGGSLVAYLMGITDCDPLRFGLLFERFINPDRIDLPDADLDFMSARRHEIVQYLIDKYGEKRVAGVSNYGKLGAASAIRDVGRIVGLSEKDYRCSKLVPKVHGQPVSLAEARKSVSEIEDFAASHAEVWDIMTKLEGSVRSLSQHAAGIVVGGVDLEERAVVERRKESAVVCWDKRIVEDVGLVKMDILGLSTLDLIKLTQDYIFERRQKLIDLSAIALDDPKVLEAFANGNTTGIFQFESGGMRRLLKDLGVTGTVTFDDITACTALYRPGPMESGMMDSFAKRKQGAELIEYDHPLMEPVLSETFGVMVYQEQVMKVSQVIAGYSGAQADKLRKIMGKKLPEEMKKERGNFVQGCVNTIGCTEEWAGELFDKIEGFAGYGFNKSHSVEYTLISYQAMWLKMNFPVEFFAAALTLMDQDKLPGLIRDARKLGIDVSMPDINVSTNRFEIATDVRLVIPFLALKGIANTTTDAIVTARKAIDPATGQPFGAFKNKADFLARVDKRRCNVKHQDILDRVGAFSRIETGQLPATDPSRILDLIELLPGLIDAHVPINHDLQRDGATKDAVIDLIDQYRAAHGPASGERDGMPVKPHFGRSAAFMIVQDCPNSDDDGYGVMGFSRAVECVQEAMKEHGLSAAHSYWTALVKRPKVDKQISADEIKTYADYIEREIELLKPPVIVLLGSGCVRHFLPDLSGKAFDHAGKVVYSKTHDANFVVGFNPGEIYFSPEKQEQLIEVFKVVVDLLS